jgi:hypothetical protein
MIADGWNLKLAHGQRPLLMPHASRSKSVTYHNLTRSILLQLHALQVMATVLPAYPKLFVLTGWVISSEVIIIATQNNSIRVHVAGTA